MTPIFLERKDGEWNAVVTDSTGLGEMPWTEDIAKVLNDTLDVKPYVYTQPRQLDNSNCSIFSIRDMVQMSKHPNIVGFAKDNISENVNIGSKVSVKTIDTLPPQMMKITQTRSPFCTYTGNKEEKVFQARPEKNLPMESIQDVQQRYERNMQHPKSGKLIKANGLAGMRFQRYARVIYARVLTLGLK